MNEYKEKSSQIRKLAAMPPDQLINGLASTHKKIADTAPGIAPHVHTTAINAVQYLNSKLPSAGNELDMDDPIPPSMAEQRQWLSLHNAVSDPTSVLDHVKNGTLSPHHVEALRTVYPDLHQEMVGKISEEIGASKARGQRVPYKTRIGLAHMIGKPIDSTMTPQSMQSIMASAMPQQMSQQKGKSSSKASGPELSQINKTNQIFATDSQSRQMNSKRP